MIQHSRDRTYTLIGILLALFLGSLDRTIVSTALPRIVSDLHGIHRYDWVATAYLLASTVLVPVYGRLADMYNRKAIELWSVGIFLSGSFLCGLAGEFGPLPLVGDGMSQLILFRAVQGMGGAGLFAMAFIIIADLYPPAERGRYQGFVGAVFGISSVLGPLIGGVLTDHGGSIVSGVEGWRWVFYVNVPFGVLAVWFITQRMPALHPEGEKEPLNYLSAALLITGLVPLILALRLDKQAHGWGDPVTLTLFAVSFVLLGLFVVRSLHARYPILDFALFKNDIFSRSNLALFFLGASFLSILIFLPLFMVQVVGVSATMAGFGLVPLSMGLVLGSTVAGQLVSRFGHYRRLMLTGGVLLIAGIILLGRMDASVPYWRVMLYMAICGIGLGPSFPLYTLAIQNAVDLRLLGQATSASQFFRQVGGVIGVAIVGTVFSLTLSTSLGPHDGDSFVDAASSVGEGSGLAGPTVQERVHDQFEERYQALAGAVSSGDAAAVDSLLAGLSVPPATQARLRRASHGDTAAAHGILDDLHRLMNRRADVVGDQVDHTVKIAFTDAITRIFTFALVFAIVGWASTWFIPEIPLRKTMDHDPGHVLE